jgi:hypothetical protein
MAELPSLGADWERERRLLVIAAALPELAPRYLANVPDEALSDPRHREAIGLLQQGVPPEEWSEELQSLASALRADPGAESASEEELRETVYRVQLPALERKTQALREAGDTEGALRMIGLVQRVRAALRGEG